MSLQEKLEDIEIREDDIRKIQALIGIFTTYLFCILCK